MGHAARVQALPQLRVGLDISAPCGPDEGLMNATGIQTMRMRSSSGLPATHSFAQWGHCGSKNTSATRAAMAWPTTNPVPRDAAWNVSLAPPPLAVPGVAASAAGAGGSSFEQAAKPASTAPPAPIKACRRFMMQNPVARSARQGRNGKSESSVFAPKECFKNPATVSPSRGEDEITACPPANHFVAQAAGEPVSKSRHQYLRARPGYR